MFRILHLSDLHIGNTYKDPRDVACKIASDIDHNNFGNIRCVAVTGDVFDGPAGQSDGLISQAVGFFDTLLEQLNSGQAKKLQKEDVLFVPGNHDIVRTDDQSARWSKYGKFLTEFYGKIPEFYNDDFSFCREYADDKVAFVGFNSVKIEKMKTFAGVDTSKLADFLQEQKLLPKTRAAEFATKIAAATDTEYDDYGEIPMTQIAPIERKVKALDNYNIVAMFHHHFYLFPEVYKKFGDGSLIRNYTEVEQRLRNMNAGVVLHGHKHFDWERPCVTDGYYDSGEVIDVFAAGSASSARAESHTFAVLDLFDKKDGEKLEHNKFVYRNEKLEPIATKRVPPLKTGARSVKLLEILRLQNNDLYKNYVRAWESSFSYNDCRIIVDWISDAVAGFTETCKRLELDDNAIYVLFALNYRYAAYGKRVGSEEAKCENCLNMWREFFVKNMKNDFSVAQDDYLSLFDGKNLTEVAKRCDKLIKTAESKSVLTRLAFTMLGIFFTDLYLALTKYADDFKESIKFKVNIKIEENKFHENVPAPRICIKSDADRRTAYVELLCNDATAHKMAVLFVKEFDLAIGKFEDFFKLIGLKLYYLLPKIDKDGTKNTLDNYNFEAYIPTLLPLLTGDNIYSSKEVFARELIQNSIDAIAVREAKEGGDFDKTVYIELGRDDNGKRYFKITDRGMGMDRYKIERYFTSIGRSFYSGDEYADLGISYKPISSFGIGFLSSFMVCKQIDVITRSYEPDSEGLKLHIPNYDGCFFIEREENVPVGTQIKLYLDDSVEDKDIVDYIVEVMRDVKYGIKIRYTDEDGAEIKRVIPAHAVRKNLPADSLRIFLPFGDNGEILGIDYEKEVLGGEYADEYEHGLLIAGLSADRRGVKHGKFHSSESVLNAGIAVAQASFTECFGSNYERYIYMRRADMFSDYSERNYNRVVCDFPANWLQLDVSRDGITGFSPALGGKDEKTRAKKLAGNIAKGLYRQLKKVVEYYDAKTTDIPAMSLQEAVYVAMYFCESDTGHIPSIFRELRQLQYIVSVEFSESGVGYGLKRRGDLNKEIDVTYTTDAAKACREKLAETLRKVKLSDSDTYHGFSIQNAFDLSNPERVLNVHFPHSTLEPRFGHMAHYLAVKTKDERFLSLTLLLLEMPDAAIMRMSDTEKRALKELDMIRLLIESVALSEFNVGVGQTYEVSYAEVEKAIDKAKRESEEAQQRREARNAEKTRKKEIPDKNA